MLSDSQLPKTWEELKSMAFFIKSTPIENLRHHEDTLFYLNYLNMVDKDLRFKILLKTLQGRNRIIIKAAFPYTNLIKNIPFVSHYCLWNRSGKLSDPDIDLEIKNRFSRQDYFWFENNILNKSIPEVWHCHIFIKEK